MENFKGRLSPAGGDINKGRASGQGLFNGLVDPHTKDSREESRLAMDNGGRSRDESAPTGERYKQGSFNGPSSSTVDKHGESSCKQRVREWTDKPVEDCSHIYSDGTVVNALFETRLEKIEAMNTIAILAYSYKVRILVQQVMTTHVHIIVSGGILDRERFARELRRRLTLLAISKRHSANDAIMVGNDPIKTERELMNKFMYVYRNAITAGYPLMPWEYVGGPGDIFFVHKEGEEGRLVSELTARRKRAMFHSKVSMPDDWRYNEEGLILPRCYVDVERIERLFRTPKAFIAFLHQSKNVEAEIDVECSREYVRAAAERELREECRKRCVNMFGKASVSAAALEERLAIARELWGGRLTYSLAALSRVTLVPQGVLESVFGRKG